MNKVISLIFVILMSSLVLSISVDTDKDIYESENDLVNHCSVNISPMEESSAVSDFVNSRSSSKAFCPNALANEDRPCRNSADEESMPLAKEVAA